MMNTWDMVQPLEIIGHSENETRTATCVEVNGLTMNNRERGKYLAIRYYQKKDRRKLRAFNHDFPLPKYFQELIGDKKSVLVADLGAGSICTLGNQWPGVEVSILASDLLADEYNEIWKNRNYVILNPVTKQDMEALTYPDNYFDIVHCVNALDHSENPRKAIQEMIRVCKPGGWVYLRHIPNEGERQRYAGFHQWNISIAGGDDSIIWNPESKFLLSDIGDFDSEVKTEVSNTMYPGEESVVSRLIKEAFAADRRIGAPSRRIAEFHLNLEHYPGSERRVGLLDRRGRISRGRNEMKSGHWPDQAPKAPTPVIQHHVMMEVNDGWVLLRTLDEDCLEQAEALASEYAALNYNSAIVATTAVEFTGCLKCSDVEKGVAAGEKFAHRDGRRIIALHPPGYFVGEDDDTLLVQFEDVDYHGDFWEEVQASNLRRLEAVNVSSS